MLTDEEQIPLERANDETAPLTPEDTKGMQLGIDTTTHHSFDSRVYAIHTRALSREEILGFVTSRIWWRSERIAAANALANGDLNEARRLAASYIVPHDRVAVAKMLNAETSGEERRVIRAFRNVLEGIVHAAMFILGAFAVWIGVFFYRMRFVTLDTAPFIVVAFYWFILGIFFFIGWYIVASESKRIPEYVRNCIAWYNLRRAVRAARA